MSANISEEESKRLGELATAKHPVAIRELVKNSMKIPAGYKITSAAVTAVRAEACDLRVTLCQGDLCIMQKPSYRFSPPLQGDNLEASLDDRMYQFRTEACEPYLSWLVTKPWALLVVVLVSGLTFGMHIDIVDALEKAPRLEATIVKIFGSTFVFKTLVAASFWFTVVAHGLEAFLALHYCLTTFELGGGPTAKWCFMTLLVGYPISSKLFALEAIERERKKSKKSK